MLGDDGYDGEENANEAVLEDGNVNDLCSVPSACKGAYSLRLRQPTLNHVRPLLGFRSQPLFSPPVHFWHQLRGHTQLCGVIARK